MMRLLKEMFIIALGMLALIYLMNPGLGIIEFIPDNIPFIGNIDEGFATMVLLAVLRYYGLDLGRFFGSRNQPPIVQGDER
jgi:uncharacterized membrane protein YkvA (DUF1232 family)